MQYTATEVKVNHLQMTNIDQGKTLPLASQKYEKSSDMHAWFINKNFFISLWKKYTIFEWILF